MKIVSWNCNGAFRKKFNQIAALDADVYIIQECENPKLVSVEFKNYLDFTENHLWHGDNNHKGVGIFTRPNFGIEKVSLNHEWRGKSLKLFVPFLLKTPMSEYKMLGLWSHGAGAKAFAYIGQSWLFLQNNKDFFRNAIVAGDFNSNVIWDAWDRWWNHSDFVREMGDLGLSSVYHAVHREQQGKELQKTFYLQRNKDKKYHIDYMFAEAGIINQTVNFLVHDFDEWKELSDHVPIEWEFKEI